MITKEEIKKLIKLSKSSVRKEEGLFIVETDHLVQEAKQLNLLQSVYTILDNYEGIKISESDMKKICNTNTVCPVIGVCRMPSNKEISNRVLILDKVSDPGNLGSLMRSAKAFGFDTIFCSDGCVDFYNDKVIRTSQGAIFKLNLLSGNIIDFITKLKNTHEVFGTNVINGISLKEVPNVLNIAVVLGNEGAGISHDVFNILKQNIYIKMNNTESLNVGVCGSIIMHDIFNR